MSRISSSRSLCGAPARAGARWLALAGLAALAAACGRPQAYVERLGNDTMSVEVFTRTRDGFVGDVLVRSPQTQIAHYEATLSPQGTIQRLNVEWKTPPENPQGPPALGFTVTIEGDSATIEMRGGRQPGTTRIAAPPGAVPLIGKPPYAFADFEQAVRQALASGAPRYPIHFIAPSRGNIVPNEIVRLGGDTVAFDYFGSPLLARVDREGRVLWRSGERTTNKLVGELVAGVDIAQLAAEFAARDARGQGMGVASPRDSVVTAVGGANIRISYSRPAKRGRAIWGSLVPWNEVWRTGANAATAFSSDRDLEIGGVAVRSGAYTLYSLFAPEGGQLIISKQIGQWGTEYHAELDLARIAMRRETLAEPVERFTIAVEPADDGGTLHLIWDTVRYSVPIRVK
jgi:hypothetical protein